MITPPYDSIVPQKVETSIIDHMGGFDFHLRCSLLDSLSKMVGPGHKVVTEYIFSDAVKSNYPILDLRYSNKLWKKFNFIEEFEKYNIHPEIKFENFICSFNGTPHVNRKFLVAILNRFGYFNPLYSSKNFVFTRDQLDGHIKDYGCDRDDFYHTFFIANDSDDFFNTVYSFDYFRFDHNKNIETLETRLTKSFLHIVSETLAVSYYPFVTEKFLYSIVTRGLFLAYAQPGWHAHLEKYYGFKKYTKLFDYRFDDIQNPVVRLLELITMISKFSTLSKDDWMDLYLMEQDTIEYNYDHYFSQRYMDILKLYE